jgi:hypothetical protein
MIKLKTIGFETGQDSVDQDGVQWWSFVNKVMSLQIPKRQGIS